MRDNFRQIQMAMAMNEIESRVAERSMIMRAMAGSAMPHGVSSAAEEEERLL